MALREVFITIQGRTQMWKLFVMSVANKFKTRRIKKSEDRKSKKKNINININIS